MSRFLERLKQAFRDEEYRHSYADEFLNTYIATQIKTLREQRRPPWRQYGGDLPGLRKAYG